MKRRSDFPQQTAVAIVAAGFFALLTPELSAKTYVVNGAHRDASDENLGTKAEPLKTIDRAAQRAQPGDTVLVHAGVYRERVAPARGGTEGQPIVYTAAPGEQVFIKGSDIWQPRWRKTNDEGQIYSGILDAAMFLGQRINPFRTPLKAAPGRRRLTLGQVFVDGQPLREVDNPQDLAATPATWLIRQSGTDLTIHFPAGKKPPSERLVEVTTRERIFSPYWRGLGYIHVRGFTMEHCANQFPDRFWVSDSPQAGAIGCRAGHHWLIEGNTVRFAKSIGIDCGYEGRHNLEGQQPTPRNTGYHVIRNNYVTDNGCCGIAGMRSLGTRIVGNVIERNNWNQHNAPEIGGIKVHYFIDGLIEGNLIRDNDAYGIWLDNVYRNARVSRNLVIGNRGSAVFVELGEGPIQIDNNVLANTRPGFRKQDPRADGLYTHDASGVLFVHNLIFGCQRFGSFHRKLTNRRRAAASRIVLRNNIFIDNQAGHINLPYPGPFAKDNYADHNLFSHGGGYLVNPWGGTPADVLIGAVEEATGIRPKLWKNVSPRMNLNQWKNLNLWDSHSVEAESAEVSISKDFVLTLDIGRVAHDPNTTTVDGLKHDFFGDLLPIQDALVGPFQRLTDGNNKLPLWDPAQR